MATYTRTMPTTETTGITTDAIGTPTITERTTPIDAPTIRVYRAGKCWIADMSRAIDGEYLRARCGTDQIPMPFTPEASVTDVFRTVRDRNPDHVVYVA